MSTGPLAPVIKGLAAGIGLASEYRHHKKEQKTAKEAVVVTNRTVTEDSSDVSIESHEPSSVQNLDLSKVAQHYETEAVDHDETQWSLDDAQDEVTNVTEKPKAKVERDPTKMVQQFTASHPPSGVFEPQKLLLPVVLPQRRPKNRTRGFIRAYAPELQDCDIDEETFIQFIEVFNTATLAAPWLDAINLASLAFVMLPTAISQAISIAIAIAVDITKNMQSRHRHNYILEQMNNDFFRPRGLYALVLTWNPDQDDMKIGVNLHETIADNLASRKGALDKAKHSFRPSMGNTIGTAFSETAPLVFPVLDSLVNSQTPEATDFKHKFKNAKGLIAEYFDRRAQAQHAGENPDSQLAVTKPVFTSRYSDPNNPSNNGDLLSLLTAGKLSMPSRRGLLQQRMGMLAEEGFQGRGLSRLQQPYSSRRGDQSQQHDQISHKTSGHPLPAAGMSLGGPNGLLTGSIRRVFQHHVLYLAIINMPTDEELAEAVELLKQAQQSSRFQTL